MCDGITGNVANCEITFWSLNTRGSSFPGAVLHFLPSIWVSPIVTINLKHLWVVGEWLNCSTSSTHTYRHMWDRHEFKMSPFHCYGKMSHCHLCKWKTKPSVWQFDKGYCFGVGLAEANKYHRTTRILYQRNDQKLQRKIISIHDFRVVWGATNEYNATTNPAFPRFRRLLFRNTLNKANPPTVHHHSPKESFSFSSKPH